MSKPTECTAREVQPLETGILFQPDVSIGYIANSKQRNTEVTFVASRQKADGNDDTFSIKVKTMFPF